MKGGRDVEQDAADEEELAHERLAQLDNDGLPGVQEGTKQMSRTGKVGRKGRKGGRVGGQAGRQEGRQARRSGTARQVCPARTSRNNA